MNASIITDKLTAIAARGIVVRVSASRMLQVRPASRLTPDDRAWLGAHAGAILAHLDTTAANADTITLSGNEPWDSPVALKLVDEADAMVARFGVDGRHPAIQVTAALVTSAHATRDLETLRFAASEFEVVLRRLAGEVEQWANQMV